MKNAFVSRKWKRIASAGLSLAMCVSLFSSVPVSAAPSEKAAPQQAVEKVPVKDKTPVTDKAGPVFMSQLDGNETQGHPFPKGTAGSNIFRIPAMITMETGELLGGTRRPWTAMALTPSPPFPATAERRGSTGSRSISQTATGTRIKTPRQPSTLACWRGRTGPFTVLPTYSPHTTPFRMSVRGSALAT